MKLSAIEVECCGNASAALPAGGCGGCPPASAGQCSARRSDGSASDVGGDFDATTPLTDVAGYLETRVLAGMSGGPLLDVQGHAVGILYGRGADWGVFTSLAPVDEYVAVRAAAAAAAASQ